MNKVIHASDIAGVVKAPASKSFMQRAIALSVLANTETLIENPSRCDDALAGLNIATSFGCNVYDNGGFISIIPNNSAMPNKLHCGESGLAIRLFTPIAGLIPQQVELLAEGSLLKRPADFMASAMRQLGVQMSTQNGFPPIKIHGPITPGVADIDGSISSQFLSGLLIALPKAKADSVLKVDKLMSIPYIDMTLRAIESFGGVIAHNNYEEFYIKGNQQYNAGKYFVEGDWSGAAGLLVAGAIGGEVTVNMLSVSSTQADMAVMDALKQAGAGIYTTGNSVTIHKPDKLLPFELDALHCPDLFPVLVALAANCGDTSKIHGVHRLVYKESNRAEALKLEFNKIGVYVDFKDDTMIIKGGKIKGGEVFAHNDHRIAMALTLAALNASAPIIINGAHCVNKTYPEFFDDMEALGVNCGDKL